MGFGCWELLLLLGEGGLSVFGTVFGGDSGTGEGERGQDEIGEGEKGDGEIGERGEGEMRAATAVEYNTLLVVVLTLVLSLIVEATECMTTVGFFLGVGKLVILDTGILTIEKLSSVSDNGLCTTASLVLTDTVQDVLLVGTTGT